MEQQCVEAWDGQCFSRHSSEGASVTDTQDRRGPIIPCHSHVIQMYPAMTWTQNTSFTSHARREGLFWNQI